jgi:hypothetical protein
MRRRASREGDRLIDFFKCRVVIFCFFEVGLLIVLTAIQFRAEPGTNPHEALLNNSLTSADSGLQFDLEIALSGVSAKIQRPRAFSARPKMR